MLACLGGIGGLLASLWTTKLLWLSVVRVFAGLLPGATVFSLDLSPDARVFAYALALSLVTGVLFGLSPAMRFSRPDMTLAVRDEATSLGWRAGRSRTRSLLVTTQVAVSMLLLISAGLLLRGLIRSQVADPGFETRRVLLLSGDLGSDVGESVVLERQLIERLQSQPAIQSAALGTMPLLGTWTPPIIIERNAGLQMNPGDRTLASYASDKYFNTLGIPLLRGRDFTEREAANNAHVAVISESTARRFWPGQDPLGKLFKLDLEFRNEFTEFQVVGVAKDVRFANLTRIDPTHIYVPTGTKAFYAILVRSQGDVRTAETSVRIAARALDKNLSTGLWIRTIQTGPFALQKSLAQTYATYAGMLAVLTLVLAGVGIYGVMAYLVDRRAPEIGVRVALGATSANVLKVIVVEGLRPAFAGMGVGITGAGALSWALHTTLAFPGAADLFYGTPFYDPVTFLGLAVFFVMVTAIGCFVPAKRAIAVDPVVALRHN
jgi:predicted permease